MWLKLAINEIRIKEAQSLGGLGPSGGGQFYGFSLSAKYGGPRWYPYSEDDNMGEFIRDQFRYHPEYVPIGEAAEISDDGEWQTVKEVKDLFYGKNPNEIKIITVPERKEKACLLLFDENSNEIRAEELPSEFDDVVKEIRNWQFVIVQNGENGYKIMGRIKDTAGDQKGIFEVNGNPSTPGFGYIWRDGPSATPSNNKHGDLTENLWNNWRSVDSPGGVVGFR